MREIPKKSRITIFFLTIGFILAGLVLFNPHKETPKIQGTWLGDGKPLQPFLLADFNGKRFTKDAFKGRWSLVFFGYTFCPDICPVALATLQEVMKRLEKSKTPLPQVVFISVDPGRDSLGHLKKYVQYFDKRFLGVTGEPKAIENIANQLGILFVKQDPTNNKNYLIDHSASVLLIGPNASLQAVWNTPSVAKTIANDFRKILESAQF